VSKPRFSVGIDLGTTNCAVSFVRAGGDENEQIDVEALPIPQLTSPGSVEDRYLLPSFLYIAHRDELSPSDLSLPWSAENRVIVGELARTRGTTTPIRLVSSAKSWLCNPGVDRRAPILPPEVPEEIQQISPLDASREYLKHMREAWNQGHVDAPLQEQDVVLTVPASFDPAARELTAEAARETGLKNLVLLEEPQAAFYSWVQAKGRDWRKQVRLGEIILVVDVGGGTTDLSLIAVTERDGAVELRRIAVGEHILLGGDNMDLTLAHLLKSKLADKGVSLDAWQLQALTHGCRAAKEALLSDTTRKDFPVVVPSRGSRLIGKAVRTELTHDEVERAIVEGFFPQVDATARPAARMRVALTRVGLPYAQDAGITRHLAAFLSRQAKAAEDLAGFETLAASGFLRPTAVLFNGGVFKAHFLAERTLKIVNGWLANAGMPPARLLEGADLDMAVAKGAAYYGHVRRGRGVRIRGGTARSFYVGIESAMPAVPGLVPPVQALCLAPFGMEEGTEADLPPQTFGLVVGEPVQFRFFGSSVRRTDTVGATLDSWSPGELEELDKVEATLPADGRTSGDIVPVRLRARLTEVGTLKLEAVPLSGTEVWAVEFNVRGSGIPQEQE
jgi:hypothetical protein